VAIGEHKSAPEMFTRRGPSEAARAESERLVATLNELVDQRWRFAPEALRTLQASSMLAAQDAATPLTHLTSQPFPEWWDSLRRPTKLDEAEATPRGWTRRPRVAVIPLSGMLVGGHGMRMPLLGMNTVGAADVMEKLDAAMADPDVVAVVLRIKSGGGSAQASEELYHWIRHHRDQKPIHVSISGLCASGCVYLAAGADRIMAERGAVIGSVGIFGGKADLSALLAWLGVTVEEVGLEGRGRAPFALHRAFSDAERAALTRALSKGLETFVARVKAHGAGATDEIADARVVETSEAKALGLIDEVGGFPELIRSIEAEVGRRVELTFPERPGVLEWLSRLSGLVSDLGRWQGYMLGPYWEAP
jgi:protease IV